MNDEEGENKILEGNISAPEGLPGLIGTSPPMLDLYSKVKQLAITEATILIEGESETGKKLIARAVHALSKRKDKTFVGVDCGALPEPLLESELFGYKKGSFTWASGDKDGLFEEAYRGTILLEEVSTASYGVQAKLLRVLQEGEIHRIGETKPRKVDVRVICTTSKDLEAEVALRRFRRDLFYRLKVVSLKVPPLRERGKDIYLLAQFFLKVFSGEFGKDIRGFSREAIDVMLRYPWEGNVSELRSAVERAVLLSKEPILQLRDIEIRLPKPTSSLSEYYYPPGVEPIGPVEVSGNVNLKDGLVYDVFICHASENKEDFVRPLAHELREKGLRVWYDEFTLTLGDSLLRTIDKGLSQSRYGVVVLSPAFFVKDWPQKELDGLASKEVDGNKVILPVWHNVTREDVQRYSPILAGRVAAPTSRGLPFVVSEILKVVAGFSSVSEPQDVSVLPLQCKLLKGRFLSEATWSWDVIPDIALECDIDGDGFDEQIFLGKRGGLPGGVSFLLNKARDSFPMIIEGLVDNFPKENHFFHLALLDVNRDSYPEVLCAVGDGSLELELSVWAFDHNLWNSTPRGIHVNPMKIIGHIHGQSQAIVLPGATIQIPIGSQGYYDTYQWNGLSFVSVGENGLYIAEDENKNINIPAQELGEYKETIKSPTENPWAKGLQFNPYDPYLHFNYGIYLGMMGKYDEAIEELKEAVRFKKDLKAANLILYHLLEKKGSLEEAREYLVFSISGDDVGFFQSVALLNDLEGRRKEARTFWKSVLEVEKDPAWITPIQKRLSEPD